VDLPKRADPVTYEEEAGIKSLLNAPLSMEGRATFLPFRDTPKGREFAAPGILAGAWNAFTLPGRALRGKVENPLEEASNFAGMVMGGGGTLGRAPIGALGMNVWHGSPRKFPPVKLIEMPDGTRLYQNMLEREVVPQGAKVIEDLPLGRFDPSKIGTGEGAQAYGYGHYVAENPQVAKSYDQAGQMFKNVVNLDKAKQKIAKYEAVLRGDIPRDGLPGFPALPIPKSWYQEKLKEAKSFVNETNTWLEKHHPSLYRVDLPDEQIAKMLDWDKPLSQQPENVRKALQKTEENYYKILSSTRPHLSEAEAKRFLSDPTGAELYLLSASHRDVPMPWRKGVSAAWRAAGIPGIRYLDQGSRVGGKGTSNFVVFPGGEDMLNILQRKAEGGEIKPVAAGLASLGRGGDSTLMHISPRELAGLQALALRHGGSLTINPHTGLYEAFKLKNLIKAALPAAAGFAMNALIPGSGALATFLKSPMGAGLVVGGLRALTSGSLEKGLMAGLGAYGGAGLGAGFANIGAAENALANQAAIDAVASGAAGIDTAMNPQFVSELQGASNAAAQAVRDRYANMSGLEKLGVMAKDVIGNPAEKDKMGKVLTAATGMGGPWQAAASLGAATSPILQNAAVEAQKRYAADFNARQQPLNLQSSQNWAFDPAYNWMGNVFERQSRFRPIASAAEGGTVPNLRQRYPQSDIASATYLNTPQVPQAAETVANYDPKINPFTGQEMMAGGGLAGLYDYAAGGRLLNGPGDGMSDSIPAVIQGPKPQRAALADGEFVVPADVVSHLGNGSTKAGAKKLYTMLDNVRRARTGRVKQARAINPNRFVPA